MKIKNTIPEIILIMLLAFSIWALLIPILGYYHEIGHATIALIFGVRIIEITHSIVLGSFNNEIFHLINSLASVMVGVFFGAKI